MNPPAPDPALRRLHAGFGTVLFLLGLAVVVGRLVGLTPPPALTRGGLPMSAMGGLSVLLAGGSILALAFGRARLSLVQAGVTAAIGATYCAAYLGVRLPGTAHLIYRPELPAGPMAWDLRIAPLGALTLLLGGILIVLVGQARTRFSAILAVGALLLTGALLSLSSYLVAPWSVASWWRYSSMTVPASFAALLAAGWAFLWLYRQASLRGNPAWKSGTLLTVAVVLVGVVGTISYLSNTELIDSSERLVQTHEVVGAVDRFVSEIARMESSARGYIMTGQAAFRDRVKDHADEVEAKLAQLHALSEETLIEHDQVELLRGLTDGKHRFIGELLRTYDEHGQAAAAQRLASEPTLTGSALVRTADLIRQEAYDLLARRQAEMQSMQTGARRVQLVAGLMAFLLILLAYVLEYRASAARTRAEQGLREANESLETRVVERTVELQQAVNLLSERERSMRFLADAMPQMVWTALPDGTTTSFNRAWYEYTGLTEEEARGEARFRVYHPDDLAGARQRMLDLRLSGQEGGGELRLRRASDGMYRWMLWRVRPELGAEGQQVRWVGILTDIHDQKAEAEVLEERVQARTAELAQVTRLQRGVLDGTVFSVIATDPAGLITEFNRGAEQMLGYRREEMVGRRTPEVIHDPAEVAARGEALTRELGRPVSGFAVFTALPRLGRTDEREWSYLRADGSRLPVLLTVTALRDPAGAIMGFLALAQDLTERKRTEDALRTSERRLREAQQLARLGHWEFKADAREKEWWSEEMYHLYGLPPDSGAITTEMFYGMVHPEDRAGVRATMDRLVSQTGRSRLQYRILRADGQVRHLLDEVETICDDQGRLQLVRGVVQDVTERQELLDSLALARDEALEASRLKSEFLANISHELRTPMNGIIGMSALLMDTALDAAQREMGQVIQSSAESLLMIINDILDFSRMEAGKMRMETADFSLRELVEDTLRLLASRAHGKGLELVCDYPSDLPETLSGDAGRIRQVLTNLVGNALKFTEKGEVVVTVRAPRRTADRAVCRFEVRDTGIGIPPGQQGRLFQAFSQVDGTHTRRFGGTGLGLAISRQLVELMHGRIGFATEEGRGSTFWFEIELPTRPTPAAAPAALPPGLRVLAVDDNATNRAILRRQLEEMHLRPVLVETAEQALPLLREDTAAGRPFDVVLLDWQMPGMDGVDLALALRAEPALAGLPLLLLSSTGLSVDPATAEQIGFEAVLTKPVRPGLLHQALLHLQGRPRETAAAHPAPATPRSGHRLLVAEDNEANQIVIRHYLARLGHEAVIVADGQAALEALAGGGFAAVLMDCQMPRMDGYEATRRIRAGEVPGLPPRLPVIALTAYAQPSDRLKCLSAGMDEYLPKPVRMDALRDALHRCGVDGNPAPPARPAAAAPSAALDLAQVQQLRDLPGRQHATLLEDLLDLFLSEAPHQLRQLQEHARKREGEPFVQLAHRLAGSCANLGGQAVRQELLQAERLGRAESWDQLPAALAAVEREWAGLVAALERLRSGPSA